MNNKKNIYKESIDSYKYGDEILIDERKKILIGILEYINNVCDQNGIHYFIAYGSLIGAIRHLGFIPWDDDIDIWVPIDEYEKLLNVIERDDKYAVGNNITDKDWYLNFAKISDKRTVLVDDKKSNFTFKGATQRGVAVDIFPLYSVDEAKKLNIDRLVQLRQRYYRFEHGCYSGMKSVILKLHELIGKKEVKYRKELLEEEKKHTEGNKIGCTISPYGGIESFDKELFSESIDIDFENIKVKAPIGYDKILTILYGDYMTLPPIEERQHLTHGVKAVWLLN